MRKDYDWHLADSIVRRLGKKSYGRQRVIYEEDTLLIILHAPPKADDITREEKVFLRSPSGEWQCNGRDDGLRYLQLLLNDYAFIEEKLEKEYHKAQTPEDHFELLEKAVPLDRSAEHIYETLQNARELIRLDQDIIDARDKAYDTHRNFSLLVQDARSALDFRIAKNAEEDARIGREAVKAQHRLNILAAIFFPLTALTAVFGMNFPSGFERFGIFGFWIVLVLGIMSGFLFRGWVLQDTNKE